MAHSKPAGSSKNDDFIWDPAYLISLRELWIIFAFFAVMLAWTIGVSFWLGYPADRKAPVELLWGAPKWFWLGVAAPWALATIASIWFALYWMQDHESPDEPATAEPSQEAAK